MAEQFVTVQISGRNFRSLDAGFRDFEKRFTGALDGSAPKIRKELAAALQLVATEMEKLHSDPWRPGGSRKGKLFRRTGEGLRSIRRSIRVSSSRNLDGIVGRIGAAFPISVHEEGAVIRAKRAQFLTIPLPAALDSRGVPLKRRARDWDDTFVARSKKGNLLIFQKRGEGIVPLYVLKREVTLPARLRLGQTLNRKGIPFFRQRALDVIDAELRKI